MILQALVKYYEELVQQGKAAKPGWCQAKSIACNRIKCGWNNKTIISLKKEEQRGKKKKVWPRTFKCTGNGYKIFRDCF